MKNEYISDTNFHFEVDICDIQGNKESERFSNILEMLKLYDIIKSYKEFADSINETSVGLNDIKKGRKKLSINHIKNINVKYPFINTDFILFREGLAFHEDFLICYHNEKFEFKKSYRFDLDAIKNHLQNSKELPVVEFQKNSQTPRYQKNDLFEELLLTKNELLKAKNKIIKLQEEIYQLKFK